jgi:hypothetical protein
VHDIARNFLIRFLVEEWLKFDRASALSPTPVVSGTSASMSAAISIILASQASLKSESALF